MEFLKQSLTSVSMLGSKYLIVCKSSEANFKDQTGFSLPLA